MGSRFNSDLQQTLLGLVLIALTGLVPALTGNPYWAHTFHVVNIFIAASIFQNMLFVDAGQKSFGQGAILGLGAYSTAILYGIHGWPFLLAALCGTAIAGLGGLLFALPALRVQGFHLGFVTMSAAIVFPQLLMSLDHWTRGINGISVSVPALTEKGPLGLTALDVLCVLLPMAALGGHYLLRHSRLGRSMFVAAVSPEAARTLGIKPGVMRFIAFVLASIGTGLAGVLYLPAVTFVSPQGFNIEMSFVFFMAVVVGGRGQMLGPIIGIWLLYVTPNILLSHLTEYRLLIYGLMTLCAVILFPDGLVGSFEHWRSRRAQKSSKGFRLETPSASASLAPTDEIILEVHGGTKAFGKVVAVNDVTLSVRKGEVHGLIGANGSGKTSLLNILSGLSRLDKGRFTIKGVDATRLPADRISNLGLARTFQTPRIFPQFSLWDNLRLGLDARERLGSPSAEIAALARTLEQSYAGENAALLPHGQRRLLEVMRTMLKEADIILFDEPAAGLSSAERQQFATLVRQLSRAMGKTVIVVEHDLQLVWEIADTITVLEQGKVVASGTPAEVAENQAAQHMFVGALHA